MKRYELHSLDFHFGGVHYIGPVKTVELVTAPVPQISALIDQIVKHENEVILGENASYHISADDIYPTSIAAIMKYWADPEINPDTKCVEWLKLHKNDLVCAFGIQADEADEYVVISIDEQPE